MTLFLDANIREGMEGCPDSALTAIVKEEPPDSSADEFEATATDAAVQPVTGSQQESECGGEAGLQFQCKLCNDVFDTHQLLLQHSVVHRFPTRQQLSRHLRSHGRNLRLVCDVCGVGFVQKASFIRHRKMHRGAMANHKCPHCPKSFFQRSHFMEHLRIHTGERPFICDLCGKGFVQRSHLVNHCRKCTEQFKAPPSSS
ncbi:gastrula zinc finger protein XlCGF67.1-like [Dermacentor albipictus]|uniref:gastrula zinc finger protein XlCGF67.1-like n=1 Tax=Dermacentor albipictus TaxID=60249 RepID=UPI0038FC4208